MKKLFTVLIVLASLVMTGCLVKDNSEEMFEKNKECYSMEAQLRKEYPTLESVFYSPKENSCLVLIRSSHADKHMDIKYGALVNLFTKENIVSWVEETYIENDMYEDKKILIIGEEEKNTENPEEEFNKILKEYR